MKTHQFFPRTLPIPPMDTEILIGSYKRDEDTGKMVGTVLWVGKVTLVAGNGFLVTGRDKQRFCYPDEPFGGDETWTYANLLDEIDGLMRLPHEMCFARAAYLKAQQEGGKP